jgi:hypothetical protein
MDDDDRQRSLSTLGEACGKTDWQVHAYCPTRIHFPLQETTTGLKWIANRLQMGSWSCGSNLLNEQPQTQRQAQ